MNSFLIRNAELFDGMGAPPFLADVAVSNGMIWTVAPAGTLSCSGLELIDAQGLALAPGFIDVHSHSDTDILAVPEADNKISQGVTTEIVGNCGFSEFAQNGRLHIARYAAKLAEIRPSVNIAALAGHNTLRDLVMKDPKRPASAGEIRKMRELLEEALAQGACGFSSGLWYYSGIYAPKEEVMALAGALRGTGKPYTTHLRSESDTLLESLQEACDIARAGDGILQVSHFKTMEKENWHKLPAALQLLEQERAKGLKIAADRYPYLYAGTGFRMCMPEPYSKMSREDVWHAMRDHAESRRDLADKLKTQPPACGWGRVIFALSPNPEHEKYAGKTIPEIAALRGLSLEETCALLLAESEEPIAMIGVLSPDNLKKLMSLDWIMPGSDGGIQRFSVKGGHPRKFGTMARFYRLACENARPEQTIRRMTSLPAETFHLTGRGVIRQGAFADLVLFDRQKFNAAEDYGNPTNPAEGIHAVFVNGVLSYKPQETVPGRAGVFLKVKNQ